MKTVLAYCGTTSNMLYHIKNKNPTSTSAAESPDLPVQKLELTKQSE
jgi:hypothetical protein